MPSRQTADSSLSRAGSGLCLIRPTRSCATVPLAPEHLCLNVHTRSIPLVPGGRACPRLD
jgi:hypothetical protein